METKDKKVTLTSEELRMVLTAASVWCVMISDCGNRNVAKLNRRTRTIIDKICKITDDGNKTFDLIAR